MRSRQLSGSSRFDRDHLIDSERRERRECHGADRGTHVPSWQRSPCRASREGQSRGCHLPLSLPARPLVRGWPPIDRRSPSMAVVGLHRGFILFLISMAAVALALGGAFARPVAPFRRRELL